ncbi:hypothetical protein [Hydrogenimonas urashimensis]|uniref:hypothetical protein n=1 Tax=Hydrogenimonas urashimensis TaxID=2740515 RepID=UPI001915E388|nr:hypothetical protein [Hydrogenimonas urashimensis]
MSFPSLSRKPVKVEIQDEFSTISTPFEAGYQQTRERHTRSRRTISAKYFVETADRDAILSHYESVRGSGSFDWTDPESSDTYTVRYTEAPKNVVDGAWPGWYEITLKMREL